MNYGNYINYKIKLEKFKYSNCLQTFECILALLVYLYNKCVFSNIVFRFVVIKCIREHGSKIFLNMFSKMFRKCPRSVNNFRTDHFVQHFLGLLVLNVFWGLKL